MGAYNSALPLLIDLVIRALGPAPFPERAQQRRTTGTFSNSPMRGDARTPARSGNATDTAASAAGGRFTIWTARDRSAHDVSRRYSAHSKSSCRRRPYPFMIESFSLRAKNSGGARRVSRRRTWARAPLPDVLEPCRILHTHRAHGRSGLGSEWRRRRAAGASALIELETDEHGATPHTGRKS